jgi:sialate O-acetylesterase
MKKILYLIAITLFIGSIIVNVFAGNIVSNGDFEQGTATASGWWTASGTQTYSIDNTSPISGLNSAKIITGTAGTSITSQGLYQALILPKAATYTVTFKAKASVACAIQGILVQSFSNFGWLASSPTFNITTSSQSFSYDITTTALTGLCKFAFYYGNVASGSTIWLDDITVVEKNPLLNTNLCNGDFEALMNNAMYTPGGYSYNFRTSGTSTAGENQYYSGWTKLKITSVTDTAAIIFDSGSDKVSGVKSLKYTMVSNGTSHNSLSTDQQLAWLFAGVKDKIYTVSFTAKSSVATTIGVGITNWGVTNYLPEQTVSLSLAPQTFTYTTSTLINQSDNRVIFSFRMGKLPAGVSVWIDDVVITMGIPVASVSVSPATALVSVGSTVQLSLSVLPIEATNKMVTWNSADTNIATVDANGLVTAKSAGTVRITATTQDGSKTSYSDVTVQAGAIAVTGVTINPTSASINTNDTKQFSAIVSPLGASNKTVVWSSDNEAVATVDANGLVKAITKGTATISATTQDGNFKATANISVAIPVNGISFSQSTGMVLIGTPLQLSPVFTPSNATNTSVSYSSNKPSVATVSSTGVVSGVSPGTAIITVLTQEGNFKGNFTATVYGQSLILPSVLSSNMVMQQDMQAALWGWGAPNESVQISASWGQTANAATDASGKWSTKIQTPKAVAGTNQTKHTLTFVGKNNTITLSNILIGDVYLCSGQSNMGFTMQPNGTNTLGVLNYATEIAAANYPNIRINKMTTYANAQYVPNENNGSYWTDCNPTTIAGYPAVPYYFARELYNNSNINIPIGLLTPAVGGSSVQSWMSRESLAADPVLKSTVLDPFDQSPSLAYATASTVLYNGIIAPLLPFSLKAFLWYQGEANNGTTNYVDIYNKLCSTMLADWRASWGQGNIPFFYVQMPAYIYMSTTLRDQQTNMLTMPNTGMVVSLDLADTDLSNIHPRNKKDVGLRLARWAEAKLYGQNITYSGPMLKSFTVEGSKIRIKFHPASVGSGLASRDGQALNNFQIAGSDNYFVTATAVIDGNDVLVTAATVINPINVAFAYSSTAIPNLINKDSLTACPFRTDKWNYNITIDPVSPNGIKEINKYENLIVYPVPATNDLFLKINDSEQKISYSIYDIAGKQVLASFNEVVSESLRINISTISSGYYILKLKYNNRLLSTYFIKK